MTAVTADNFSATFAQNPIIVALDGIDAETAMRLIDELRPHVWGFKLNDLLHDPALAAVRKHAGDDVRWFYDLKMHDIPNTVENTMRRLVAAHAPDLVTVHTSGGVAMMRAAVKAATESGGQTQVLGVTVLTSMDAETCDAIFGQSPAEKVRQFALFARDAGCWGIVCAAHELGLARELGIRAVVPGIRPEWDENSAKADDQRRVATPAGAIQAGATALVIGRPIVRATSPADAAQRTLAEIRNASA